MKQLIWIVFAVTDSGDKTPLVGFSGPLAHKAADDYITRANKAHGEHEYSAAELLDVHLVKLLLFVHDATPTTQTQSK